MKETSLISKQIQDLHCLEQLTNSLIAMACALGRLTQRMIDDAKRIGYKIPFDERGHWNAILRADKYFHGCAMKELDKDEKKKFDNASITLGFLFLELVTKCDNSNTRLWQFHNLLKAYPTVFDGLEPTLDEEIVAFADVFGKNPDGTPIESK